MLKARMRKRWRLVERDSVTAGDVARLARSLAVHPLVARLLANRGLDQPETARQFLNPSLSDLHDPAQLPGVPAAAERLAQAVRDKQPIVIYGDYDVDGITASAILWHTLQFVGGDVHTYVPHRIDEGYGLNGDAIAQIARGELADGGWPKADGVVPLIISVDCGITAIEPAKVARSLGIDLIITDHHEFDPANLPNAHTLVHPRLNSKKGDMYNFPDLCGAGVAFKLAWQFARVWCGSQRLPETFKTLMVDLLSLAALGTIADVVPLVDENRILARFGLGRIKHTRFVGLNALIDASRLRDEKIDAYHVGFVLGPRLNACGRMGHAARAVHLLTRAAPDEAKKTAEFLTAENDRRRATEREIFSEAKAMVVERGFDQPSCRAMVLGKEGWHPGVIGIVASRLVEAFARPVVMLSFDDGQAHGSARSVEGVSIHEALAACGQHLTRFGGHAMAAGLHLDVASVDLFRDALVSHVNAHLSEEDLVPIIAVDAPCKLEELTVEMMEQLNALAPFGRANVAPRLCVYNVSIARPAMRVGAHGAHLKLCVTDGSGSVNAIAFGMGDLAEELAAGVKIDMVFEPKINEWNGRRSAEMVVADIQSPGINL